MKFLKKGFTLSELLIAMTIIGIVAAIVIPPLVSNAQKNQAGAVLGKSIEQLEVGFQNVIQTANDHYIDGNYVDTLAPIISDNLVVDGTTSADSISDSVVADGNIYSLGAYLGLSPTNADVLSIRSFNDNQPNTDAQSAVGSSQIFKFTASPAEVALRGWDSGVHGNPSSLGDKNAFVATVYIDINGFSTTPNILGKDIFSFRVRNNAKLIPDGLNDYQSACSKGSVGTGASCAASVVKDGFKITYY